MYEYIYAYVLVDILYTILHVLQTMEYYIIMCLVCGILSMYCKRTMCYKL